MPALPLSGMISEIANRFEVDVYRVENIDEEQGVLRPVRNAKVLNASAPSNTQSLAYLPNATSETDYVLLDTPYSTRWNRYVIDTRIVNGTPVWRAHTLSGSNILSAEYPSLPAPILRQIAGQQPKAAPINDAPTLNTTTIGTNTYTSTIEYRGSTNTIAIVMTGSPPASDSTAETEILFGGNPNLSEYGSLIIDRLIIKGLSGHTFENLYFAIRLLNGDEIITPILSYGSRRIDALRIPQTQAAYSNIEYREIELDISGVPRTALRSLKVYWVVIGGTSPAPPDWTIEVHFTPDGIPPSALPIARCGGMFQSAAYGFVSAIRQKDTRNEFQELINQSANSNAITQPIGQPKKFFSLQATVSVTKEFMLNLATNPPPSTTLYELVLGITTGNSWQEIATIPIYLPHAVCNTAISSGSNITVDLTVPNTGAPYDYQQRHTSPETSRCLIVHGSQHEVVGIRKDVSSPLINRYVIVSRGLDGTTPQSFPSNAKFYFLDMQFRLNRMQTIRGWLSGGTLPYGPIITAYDRIVCADISRSWIQFSTKNHPLMFPTRALVAGDGFAQPMPDLIYDFGLEGGNLIAHGKQFVYSIVVPERQTQVMPIVVPTPKSRNHQCISYGYVLTIDGVMSRDRSIFSAKYNDMNKRAKLIFTGARLYWFYGTFVYWSDPNEKGVYRMQIPNAQEILDIDAFEEDAVVIIRRSDTQQLQVLRLRAGSGRIPNGKIEYGWIGESKRAQIARIHVWGRDLEIQLITPNGTTSRHLDYEGLLSIDMHAPNRKLTQDFQIRVIFKTEQSYLERIIVEPLVSPFPSSVNT